MRIRVRRFTSDDDTTLSTVWLNNIFECFGLEDEYREDKVAKETRIPKGMYNVTLRTWGGFHVKYSKRFPIFHEGMLQVMDVPGFTSILIHMGNTDDDTAGCLLIGQNAVSDKGFMTIGNSKGAYIEMYQKVLQAIKKGEMVTIEYVDQDR